MFKLLRLTAGLTCLGGLALGVLAFDPAGRLVSSFRGHSANNLPLAEELGRTEQFNQFDKALRRRREAKLYLAEEVIDRQLSLAEAIEKFQGLDHGWSPSRRRVAESWRISEDESDGQGVLIYVRFVLQSRPQEADAVLARLEKELQEILAERKKRPAAPLTEQRSR